LVTTKTQGGWKLTEPKTKGSRRVVTPPPATIQAIAAHRGKQEVEKIAGGNSYQDQGLVFAGQRGCALNLANLTTRHFRPLLKAAGLPRVTVYSLRHMHATHLLSAGVPLKVVSERLGHASATMTLEIYAHVLAGQQEDVLAKLAVYEDIETR
jgi:integrase